MLCRVGKTSCCCQKNGEIDDAISSISKAMKIAKKFAYIEIVTKKEKERMRNQIHKIIHNALSTNFVHGCLSIVTDDTPWRGELEPLCWEEEMCYAESGRHHVAVRKMVSITFYRSTF